MIPSRTSNFLLILFPLVLISSCQPIYRPNVVNQPMLSGQGDVQASGHVGTNGSDLQAAGAVTDNILAMINYNSYSRTVDFDSSVSDGFEGEHQLIEIAGGYYQKLGDEGENNDFGVFEAIGGYGNGTALNYTDIWTFEKEKTEGKYHKIFIQPGIGFSHDIFDVGIASRVSMIDYYDVELQGAASALQPDWEQRGTDFFLEPALTGRLGYKFIKVQMQLGTSFPLGGPPSYTYQPFMFSVGLHIDLDMDYL